MMKNDIYSYAERTTELINEKLNFKYLASGAILALGALISGGIWRRYSMNRKERLNKEIYYSIISKEEDEEIKKIVLNDPLIKSFFNGERTDEDELFNHFEKIFSKDILDKFQRIANISHEKGLI